MANLQDIIKDKLQRLETIPAKFVTAVDKSQKQIFKELISLLDSLETSGGKILTTQKNIEATEVIAAKLKTVVFESDYRKAVISFASEFKTQGKITDSYFAKVFKDDFDEKEIYKSTLRAAQINAIDLFSEAAISQEFINPAKQLLQTSVITGQSFSDAVTSLSDYVNGTDKIDGTLARYVKQVASDSFSFADRQYTKVIAEELGIEWYHYVGGLIADSREFCIERNGKYYHKKEVEAWGEIKAWQGRAKGTNPSTIFTFAGGYNCEHSILPTSISVVPPEVIKRNINSGNYKQ